MLFCTGTDVCGQQHAHRTRCPARFCLPHTKSIHFHSLVPSPTQQQQQTTTTTMSKPSSSSYEDYNYDCDSDSNNDSGTDDADLGDDRCGHQASKLSPSSPSRFPLSTATFAEQEAIERSKMVDNLTRALHIKPEDARQILVDAKWSLDRANDIVERRMAMMMAMDDSDNSDDNCSDRNASSSASEATSHTDQHRQKRVKSCAAEQENECVVCMEPCPDILSVTTCDHTIHRACLSRHIDRQLELNRMQPWECPVMGCTKPIFPVDLLTETVCACVCICICVFVCFEKVAGVFTYLTPHTCTHTHTHTHTHTQTQTHTNTRE